MSLINIQTRMAGLFRATSIISSRLDREALSLPAVTSVMVRGKKTSQVGSTKNKCGHPKGKKRGMKVYDGQRVPAGSVLCNQLRVLIFPGWNATFTQINSLKSTCHGRVMLTTEKVDPKYGKDIYKVEKYFPENIRSRNIFRTHVHVIPDEQHQYFKLLEQV